VVTVVRGYGICVVTGHAVVASRSRHRWVSDTLKSSLHQVREEGARVSRRVSEMVATKMCHYHL
jgi:hypothetical protein